MSEPVDDLFGPVPPTPDIAPAQKPATKRAKGKPAPEAKRRLVAPAPQTVPKVYEPIPMGHRGGGASEAAPAPPALPRYERRRLAALAVCDCCGRPSTCDEEFVIRREEHRDEVVRVCEPCRASTGADFPRGDWLAGALAGPWVVALLREAGRLPYEARRGHL